jgi:uncharacterized protein involved in exopolysaccharide biosynthesis
MSEAVEPHRGDLSLIAMWRFLVRHIVILASFVVIFSMLAALLAFSLKPMYRAEVVVWPADSSSGLGGLTSQLGGLASLAGINLGGGGGKKSDEALEFLRSRNFTAAFIERHALMPVLFAKKWDSSRGRWREGVDIPTIAEGVARFSKRVRQISEDRRTGVVTMSIVWGDRVAAAQWANWLISEADQALRDRAISEQSRSIDYLKAEAERTPSVEIGNAISKLMETELKNAMVARTRDAYSFKVIDPALVRDQKDYDSPNRPLIVFLGAGFGLVVGAIVAATRQRRVERR